MNITVKALKQLINEVLSHEIKLYLDALKKQREAEETGDVEGAKRAAHKAASVFFVMKPIDQTVASKEARRLGLSK